jgi:signal transduction histidine kinase/ActR/RegA family two-component response regulator
MKNFKIKHKVILGIGIIVSITIVLGLLTYIIEKDIKSRYGQIIDNLTDIHDLQHGDSYHLEWKNELGDLIVYDRPFEEVIDYSKCEFDQWINEYTESNYFRNASSEYKQTILKIDEYHVELHKSAQDAISNYKAGNKAEAKNIYDNDVRNNLEEFLKYKSQAETALKQKSTVQKQDINKLLREIDIFNLSGAIISILIAIIVILVISKKTIGPLSMLIETIKNMNKNEVYHVIEDIHTNGEVLDLIIVFNHMVNEVNNQQIKLQDQNEELLAQGEELAAQNEEIIAQQLEMQESFEKVSKHEEQLNRLYQFGKLLNQTMDQRELIKYVLEGLQEEMNAQVGVFTLYNQEKNILELKYTSGLLDVDGLTSLKLGEGLIGRSALQMKTLMVSYDEGQLRTQGLHGRLIMSEEIYQPLTIHNRLLGVIALGRLGDNPFSISEQKLLASMADQISVAIDNTSKHLQTKDALDKIQEVDKLKSEMINTVSHELRTPLASILGFTELLLKKSPNEVKAKKYLSTIYDEAERLKNLINDFLDLQKIEAGRFDFQKTYVNLPDLLQKCTEVYGEQDKHVITLDVEDGLPLILTDPEKVAQVVGNLLSNAVKYSPNGGQISVSAYRSGEDRLRVVIKDQGLGIPKESQKSLFKPFYRVDNSDRREIGGTGLGLSICKKIILALGGDIWVESVHGEGSIFSFTLPLADKAFEPKEDVIKESKTTHGTKGLILVVEDDQSLGNLMSEALKEDGYKTVVFDNGPSALAFVEKKLPQAIVLDLILVGPLDGWEVLRHLKMNKKMKNIPVIISSSVDQKEQGKKFDVADYLVKPFPPEKLVSSIHTVTRIADGYIGIPRLENVQNTEVVIQQALNDKGFNVREIKRNNDVYVINIEPEDLK